MGGLSLNCHHGGFKSELLFFFLSVCLIFNTFGIRLLSHFSGNTIFRLTKQNKTKRNEEKSMIFSSSNTVTTLIHKGNIIRYK